MMATIKTPSDASHCDLRERFNQCAQLVPQPNWAIEPGRATDYHALSAFHYRNHRPGTFIRVWKATAAVPSAASRFVGQPHAELLAGVLVESLPTLNCQSRDQALGNRYSSVRQWSSRARLLNREIRCISRVVVHPIFRGLGLAHALVRHALDHAETDLTEALAAMGHVNPFFERAGMVRYDRPIHRHDQRLLDALHTLGLQPMDLACGEAGTETLAALSDDDALFLSSELDRWQRQHRGSKPASSATNDLLLQAGLRLTSQPVYYLSRNIQSKPQSHRDTEQVKVRSQ